MQNQCYSILVAYIDEETGHGVVLDQCMLAVN